RVRFGIGAVNDDLVRGPLAGLRPPREGRGRHAGQRGLQPRRPRPILLDQLLALVFVQLHASNKPAAPWPPPMHIVTTPSRALRLSIWWAMVPPMRGPVIPKGCPMEIEPPLGFSFSGSRPSLSRQ